MAEMFADVPTFLGQSLGGGYPRDHRHDRQTALIEIQLPDPLIERSELSSFNPPRQFVRQPKSGGVQVLQKPSAQAARLTDIPHITDISRVSQGIDGAVIRLGTGQIHDVRGDATTNESHQLSFDIGAIHVDAAFRLTDR